MCVTVSIIELMRVVNSEHFRNNIFFFSRFVWFLFGRFQSKNELLLKIKLFLLFVRLKNLLLT